MDTLESPVPDGDLVTRVKNILLQPKTEWERIARETPTIKALYLGYVAILAAIPAICAWIGMSLVGINVLGMHYRIPVGSGLAHAVVAYVLTLVGVFVLALIIDALAPTFGGQRDRLQALKVAAYSGTPGWLAGVLLLVPTLGILRIIASLYGLYLLYLGLPHLMKSPQDKAVGYTVLVIVAAIVIFIVIGAIAGLLLSHPQLTIPTLPSS